MPASPTSPHGACPSIATYIWWLRIATLFVKSRSVVNAHITNSREIDTGIGHSRNPRNASETSATASSNAAAKAVVHIREDSHIPGKYRNISARDKRGPILRAALRLGFQNQSRPISGKVQKQIRYQKPGAAPIIPMSDRSPPPTTNSRAPIRRTRVCDPIPSQYSSLSVEETDKSDPTDLRRCSSLCLPLLRPPRRLPDNNGESISGSHQVPAPWAHL